MSRHLLGLLVVALAVGACDVPVEEEVVELPFAYGQPIVGGVEQPNEHAVVALAEGPYAFCSATLIGEQTVLTAAHCFVNATSSSQYRVLFGATVSSPSAQVQVTEYFIHPLYDGVLGNGNDAAVLKLQSKVSGVTPIRINTTPMSSSDVGKDVRHVGYGLSDGVNQTGFGIKREATFPIRKVFAREFESGSSTSQTCNGDSGGPGFMVTSGNAFERVVGIVSYGDAECQRAGYDTRVDTVADFIVSTAAAWEQLGSCATDGVCHPGCLPAPDDDCACASDGVCGASCSDRSLDEDCLDLGESCTAADQCVGDRCVTDPQHSQPYCSQPCSASTACPDGFTCVDSVCQYAQAQTELTPPSATESPQPTASLPDTGTKSSPPSAEESQTAAESPVEVPSAIPSPITGGCQAGGAGHPLLSLMLGAFWIRRVFAARTRACHPSPRVHGSELAGVTSSRRSPLQTRDIRRLALARRLLSSSGRFAEEDTCRSHSPSSGRCSS